MYVLAQVLEAKGDAAGCRAFAARASRPRSAGCDRTQLSRVHVGRARRRALDEAINLVQRALKIEPDNPSFLDSLGWAYFRQGRLDLADRPLTDAAAKLPTNSVVQDHLGDLRFKQGRYAEATAAWEQSLQGDGESIDRARHRTEAARCEGEVTSIAFGVWCRAFCCLLVTLRLRCQVLHPHRPVPARRFLSSPPRPTRQPASAAASRR